MSLRGPNRSVELVGFALSLALLPSVSCEGPSQKWKDAECVPNDPDKPRCPDGTICLTEDYRCHTLCDNEDSSLCPLEQACFPEGVCRDYEAECDASNPCMGDFYCEASTHSCRKKSALGAACSSADACWSGVCQDGFCCANCSESCMACAQALTGQPSGTCAHILAGRKRGEEDCPDPLSCDGAGGCATKGRGQPCAADLECTSSFCSLDGVCCDEACDASGCVACTEENTGVASGTCADVLEGLNPFGKCAGALACRGDGQCYDKPLGTDCTGSYECTTGSCADGYCCDEACTGICMACAGSLTGDSDGMCAPVLAGLDPHTDCGPDGCSDNGACVAGVANGVPCGRSEQCQSRHSGGGCVDGVCCESLCAGTCEACVEARTGTADGTCAPIPEPFDPDSECLGAGGFGCNGAGACNPERAWSSPVRIAGSGGNLAGLPRIAVDGSGNAIAVWTQHTGSSDTPTVVWANRFVPGVGWGTAQTLHSDTTGTWRSAGVAVNAGGNAVVAWPQSSETSRNIWATRYIVGRGWQIAEKIETKGGGQAGSPSVAIDDAGNAFVVWQRLDSVGTDIWVNRFEVGLGWTGAELLEHDDETVRGAGVAASATGDALAAWEQHDGVRYNLLVARYTAAGRWETPVTLSNKTTDVRRWDLDMDAAGDAVAVWSYEDGSANNTCWARSFRQGVWSGARAIGTSDGGPVVDTTRVAVAADGSALAVCSHGSTGRPGTSMHLWANRFLPGSGWGTPILVETYDGFAVDASIGVDAAGNAVAVWRQTPTGSQADVMASRLVATGDWTTPVEVDTGTEAVYRPRVGVGSSGDAVAIWYQDGDIWGAVLR